MIGEVIRCTINPLLTDLSPNVLGSCIPCTKRPLADTSLNDLTLTLMMVVAILTNCPRSQDTSTKGRIVPETNKARKLYS
jgi:hypothetical protein